ncbi:MAG: MurT ligase domain-containing protein [Coriobacteriia bacterium]|nr:MurT ligase domain-containing protein [Coriobacteriia bacterium]
MRRFFALVAARLAYAITHLVGAGGTSLPGLWARAIDPQLLTKLAAEVSRGTIVVTGTNGKTTVTNLCAQMLRDAGYTVVCNAAGANMPQGVLAAFLRQVPLVGRLQADYAVIEVDELYATQICAQVGTEARPTYVVVTNLFPDQLDRFGSVEAVREALERAIAHTPENATVVLNADNPDSLALRAAVGPRAVVTFGIEFGIENEADYRATHVAEGVFKVDDVEMATDLSGTYNLSNIMAALAVARREGVEFEQIRTTLAYYRTQPGRMERLSVADKTVVLNMAKNPAGFNQSLAFIAAQEREGEGSYSLLVATNNTPADGESIDWYADIEYATLRQRPPQHIVVSGSCAGEMATFVGAAGVHDGAVQIEANLHDALRKTLAYDNERLYILASYTALFPLREELVRR